jgi:hypothetical protein
MQSSAKSSSDAKDFSEDLKRIKTRIQCETLTFDDMPADGKRKCIDDLEHTIRTLQKIKNDLKEAENSSPDKNLLQILWKGHSDCTFVVSDFEKAFSNFNDRSRQFVYSPRIESIIMQDNFRLDGNKMLQPTRMCFIKFSTEEDACLALGLQEMQVTVKGESCSFGVQVQFIQPTYSLAMHKTFRIIGNSLCRLEEIDRELKKIGAVRRQGGVPEMGPELVDKTCYLAKLQECKRLRVAGVSLDLHSHVLLVGRKPVDSEAFRQLIKQLCDEECDILIQLREYQLNGVDFNFKHPAC